MLAHNPNPRTETLAIPAAADVASRPPGMKRAPIIVP
ncbi:hypothetical protein PJL18_04426 [Paenarthrobacter nicotinovorans]|nr:hypothetical protein [Paenarthrobacter nicotinovorans]